MSEIPLELVERMAAHLRECSTAHNVRPRDPDAQRRYDEMQAIAAELPAPVDPDLVEARKIAASFSYRVGTDSHARVINGSDDSSLNVRETLAGIKRGRELALATPATSA